NNYILTDSSGKTYQLKADNSKLKDHVGHQVSISGSMNPSDNSLQVDSVSMISDKCTAASAAGAAGQSPSGTGTMNNPQTSADMSQGATPGNPAAKTEQDRAATTAASNPPAESTTGGAA